MSQLFCVSIVILLSKILSFCEAKYSRTLEGKIVGGQYTNILNFPHAVFLWMRCGSTSYSICGASVLNQHILSTAAHCVNGCKGNLFVTALAGHENLDQVTVERKVKMSMTHHGYKEETFRHDISLILLSVKLPLGKRIKRVIIKPWHAEELTATVAGWGVIDDVTRERPMTLKMVQQTVQPLDICSVAHYMHLGMMCAGSLTSTKNRPSRGDSGSGLVTSDYQQIGIVSFRNEQYPGLVIYTNVSYYYGWIKQASKKMYCSPTL